MNINEDIHKCNKDDICPVYDIATRLTVKVSRPAIKKDSCPNDNENSITKNDVGV